MKKREKVNSMIDSTLIEVSTHYLQNDIKHFVYQKFLTECEEHPLKGLFEFLFYFFL